MAFDLASISSTRRAVAPKIVIGGPGKIGKTTFAASAPHAIGILTEDGAHALDVQAFPICTSLDDVYSAIGTLISEDHPFKSVFIDSLDWLEPLVHAHVCKVNNWISIEQPGYGKGYVAATSEWHTLLEGLDALAKHRQMTVILIVHDKIRRIEDPMQESLDIHDLKLHDKASALVKEWADVLGYCGYDIALKKTKGEFGREETRALRVQQRTLYLETHPAHFGGNRFRLKNCPLDWSSFAEQLASVGVTK